MRRIHRIVLVLALVLPVFVVQPVPAAGASPGLRAVPDACCRASCACEPDASCGCEVRAPEPGRSPDPAAPSVTETAPSVEFIRHPVDCASSIALDPPRMAHAATPEAFKHPGCILELFMTLLV